MSEIDFTIMIPTRKRPTMLWDLVQSIFETSQEKDKIEVLVTYDRDDNSTLGILPNFKDKYNDSYNLRFLSRDRSWNINNDYYNWMAKNYATGKYLIAINDDTRFLKYAWDSEAKNTINRYLEDKTDGIFYGITDDREVERKRNHDYWFSCFPLISKKAVDTLGFFFDPQFGKDGADWDIFATYREIGRVLDLRPYIVIEHISIRSGRRPKDQLDYDYWPAPPNPDTGYKRKENSHLLNKVIFEAKGLPYAIPE